MGKEKERKSARENIMDMSSIWRPNGYRRSRLDRFFLLFDKERKKLSKRHSKGNLLTPVAPFPSVFFFGATVKIRLKSLFFFLFAAAKRNKKEIEPDSCSFARDFFSPH